MKISDEEVKVFLEAWGKEYIDRNMQLRAALTAALRVRKKRKQERKDAEESGAPLWVRMNNSGITRKGSFTMEVQK